MKKVWLVFLLAVLAPWSAFGAQAASGAATTAVVIKASAGSVVGIYALNGNASACFAEFINAGASPVLGTNAVFSVPLPASTSTPVYLDLSNVKVNFSSGVSLGFATTNNGSSACAAGSGYVVLYE